MESFQEPSLPTLNRTSFDFRTFLRRLQLQRHLAPLDTRLLALTVAIGSLSGLVAALYLFLLRRFTMVMAVAERHLSIFGVMTAAGLLGGLCYWLGEPGETDAVVDNIHVRNGRVDPRANLPLVPLSLLSISAGGSAGPEAPMVYLTGSLGTWLQRWIAISEKHTRILTFTGMSVGFAALFGAPVGATLFALEIPHRRGIEYFEATIPALIGCLAGYGVFVALGNHGFGSIWHFAPYQPRGWRNLAAALGLGLLGGLAAGPYLLVIHWLQRLFKAWIAPHWLKGAAGGSVLALIAFYLPATRYFGEAQLQAAVIDAPIGVKLLLILAAAKALSVAVTLASGWRGGIIIPSFFIGACVGKAASLLIPGMDPTLAMICGMAAVNTSVMKVPLATTLVVASMAGIYSLAPLAMAAFSAFLVTGGIGFLDSQRERDVVPPSPDESETESEQSLPDA